MSGFIVLGQASTKVTFANLLVFGRGCLWTSTTASGRKSFQNLGASLRDLVQILLPRGSCGAGVGDGSSVGDG